ncbi:MAG: hypothetical protein WCO78_00170 [Candidatus Roizmanbacteria bacterium]
MIYNLSSQTILSFLFGLVLVGYLLISHLISMYRKIMQCKQSIIQRYSELNNIKDNERLASMVSKLLDHQIDLYKICMMSFTGTILRKLKIVNVDSQLFNLPKRQ